MKSEILFKGERMIRKSVFILLISVAMILIVSQLTLAKSINGYDEMFNLLPGGMTNFQANRPVIADAQKRVAERQMTRKRRTIKFVKPIGIDVLNEKYISVAFDVQIMPRKPAVFALLFETNGENPVTFPNTTYLVWVGQNDLKIFSEMTPEGLFRSYQDMGVEDCKPGYVRTGIEKALLGKADISHTHDSSALISGMIPESLIDEGIARDSEIRDAVTTYVTSLEKRVVFLEKKLAAVNELLSGVSRRDGTIVLSNVNLQLLNGRGATGLTNGKGNLIVGYNESRGGDVRTGSHNIIVGSRNNYASFGGIVAGSSNGISGKYASVIGGHSNSGEGDFSTVTGGSKNSARGRYTSISGQNDRIKVGSAENPHFKSHVN